MKAIILYALNKYGKKRSTMPRIAIGDNKRMNLRVLPDQKATLMRAAALKNTDLTDFVLQVALREAKAVIEEAERVTLSERDTRLWLDLLDNPPKPNARLIAAVKSLPRP
jgi:uncharacterized protein (DUF1778 family)